MPVPIPRSLALLSVTTALLASTLAAQEAVRVTVAAAHSDEVTESVRFIGTGEAIDTIDVVARVSGFIEEIAKDDGGYTTKGEELFAIEADAYAATLDARNADLAQAIANRTLTELELERKETLLERGSGTEADRDVALANQQVAEAQVKAAQAAIKQAELDLSYTKITAPFDGRLGRIQVSEGELVTPSSGALVTLVRVDPIYVTFSVSERQFITLLQQLDMTAVEFTQTETKPDISVILPNGKELDETGEIVFVDNRVDPLTGSIAIRAEFANTRELISDGGFVTLEIAAPNPVEALLIPQAAVQRDQKGDFVLVVSSDGTVTQRHVTLGQQVAPDVVVEEGLQEGEAVITEGLQKVRPGAKVEAVRASDPQE